MKENSCIRFAYLDKDDKPVYKNKITFDKEMRNNMDYKEWTDHKRGYRYYVDNYGSKVKITIVTYPDRDKVFETTMDIHDYNAFIDYIKF